MINEPIVVPPGINFQRYSADVVTAVTRTSVEFLSHDLLQVVLVFSDPTTIADAHQGLDTDCDLSEFAELVQGLMRRGLLERVRNAAPSLISILSVRVDRDRLRRELHLDNLVVIPDAFPADMAEGVWSDLHAARWSPSEGESFRYASASLLESQSPRLIELYDMWLHAKSDMTDLSGVDCSGTSEATASWYRPGDYASPHTDTTSRVKTVAFNWYLAKDWRREWGGALFWCRTGQHILPMFNTVVLFRPSPLNWHAVCPPASAAMSRRIAVNGFWQRSGDLPGAIEPGRGLTVTSIAYGNDNPVVVL